MNIVDNKALQMVLPTPMANAALAHIAKSRDLGGDAYSKELLVYWDYPEAASLAFYVDEQAPDNALPNVPSPILRDYNWPGIYKPFEHQKDTASFLSLRQRAFCFNEAGTGKTSAAIWAADYLMNLGHIKRVLVICPLSIMYSAWQADIFKTAMHRTCGVAHGSQEKRRKLIKGDYEFIIINFDGVHTVFDDLANGGFDLIIVDEANAYKSATTRRWKTLAKLLKPSTRLWMMTGTPAAQSPVDAFGLAKLVSPTRVPRYTGAWKDMVMYQITRFTWKPRLNSERRVHEALQPAIRYTKAECLDLPPVVYQTRDVPLTPQVSAF